MRVVAIPALLAKGNEAWIGYSLVALLLAYGLILWLAPSRAKSMAKLASQLGLRFEPIVSRQELGIRGTTFDLGYPAENCMRGMIAGRETLIFDKTMPIEPINHSGDDTATCERTIVGFHVPTDAYCRDCSITQPGDFHVEKMSQWVFVYGRTGLIKTRNIPAYVEEARGWFERATVTKA